MFKTTMKCTSLIIVMSQTLIAHAQAPTSPVNPAPTVTRARGPGMALALEAAQATSATCTANGYRVTVLVVDSANVTVVMLSADGAKDISTTGVPQKTAAALRYNMASGEVANRVKNDAALAAEIKADSKIVSARQGALLLKAGNDTIGAIGVSGGPSGEKDEACAQAGIDKIKDRLQ